MSIIVRVSYLPQDLKTGELHRLEHLMKDVLRSKLSQPNVGTEEKLRLNQTLQEVDSMTVVSAAVLIIRDYISSIFSST